MTALSCRGSRATLLAAALLICLPIAAARADDTPNPGPTPPASASTNEPTKPASNKDGTDSHDGKGVKDVVTTPTAPAIAPPEPGAPPEKVKQAKETAAARAQLTPVKPSPGNPLKPAFQLYVEIDIPVLGLAAVFASARLVQTKPAYCAPLCDVDKEGLNPIDRLTAGWYSPTWATASDYALYGTIVTAAATLVIDEGPLDALNDSVVIAESALSATGVASILTLAEGRPRPFLFGTAAPLSERNSADAGLSFLSSHTTVTAAIGMSMYMTMRRLHPNTPVPIITLIVGSAATAFVGLARVEAGKHFITDVLGGALVGGSLGVLIPALHGSPVRIVPVVSETDKGLGVGGKF